MLKRTVVRLLLVGIPFCLSYIAMRPAPAPAPPVSSSTQTFVICSVDGQGQEIVIATEKSACKRSKTVGATSQPGRIVPAMEPLAQKSGDINPSKDLSF